MVDDFLEEFCFLWGPSFFFLAIKVTELVLEPLGSLCEENGFEKLVVFLILWLK